MPGPLSRIYTRPLLRYGSPTHIYARILLVLVPMLPYLYLNTVSPSPHAPIYTRLLQFNPASFDPIYTKILFSPGPLLLLFLHESPYFYQYSDIFSLGPLLLFLSMLSPSSLTPVSKKILFSLGPLASI